MSPKNYVKKENYFGGTSIMVSIEDREFLSPETSHSTCPVGRGSASSSGQALRGVPVGGAGESVPQSSLEEKHTSRQKLNRIPILGQNQEF
jgi:hypothetical protein